MAPPQVVGFDPDFKNPRAKQVSAGVEHQIGKGVAASLNYVHISTDHLQRRLDRNLFAPTIDATGMPIFPRTRPDSTIGILSINESTAKSRYDAVATSVQARYGRLNAQASYTLAWNKDDDSNERAFNRETVLNPFDVAPEWTSAKQDARHTVSLSGVADLPRGFAFGMVLLAHSAIPYTAVIGFDTQNDGNDVNDRAIVGGRVTGRNVPAALVLRPRPPPRQGNPLRQVESARPHRRALQHDGRGQQELRGRRHQQLRHAPGAGRHRRTAALRADDGALRRPAPAAARRALLILRV